MRDTTNRRILVCDRCLKEACAAGDLMCESARSAGYVWVPEDLVLSPSAVRVMLDCKSAGVTTQQFVAVYEALEKA